MSTVAAAREQSGELTAQRDAPLGGQAVMEGVMMRGVSNWAVGVRKPLAGAAPGTHLGEGEIEVKSFPLESAMRRHRVLRLPIIRGVVALGSSLAIGFKALEISANAQLVEQPHAPGADEAQADGPTPAVDGDQASVNGASSNGASANGASANGAAADDALAADIVAGEVVHAEAGTKAEEQIPRAVWLGTIVVALVLAIALFFVVPVGITSLIKGELGSSFLFWLVEGCIRTALFLGYMFMLSRVKDLRRVFEYHGAEHKTISCFEAGMPLTAANAQRFSRLHPRCGTSFLLVVMIVAIFVFAPIGLPAWYWLVLTRIIGVPLIAGISFELIKYAGRHRSRRWVRAVMWPGLKLQLLTTREPDHSQLDVAIAALQAVLAVEKPGELTADDLVGVEVVA
ncbi:MAG TPA: DUF1385 domain-containing protein [Solirubrobacteraceae bacterium]|nr:DUF1385 domain-containing protein [Solirubrobacteraceae bacterium]